MRFSFKQYFVLCLVFSSGVYFQTSAHLDFYGYRRKSDKKNSDTTYVLQRLGSVQLETSKISITSRGSYLDIVEDAWLSGNVSGYQVRDMTEHFLLKGTLPVPKKAAITGLETWKYNTMFRAALKPTTYTYDEVYPDCMAMVQHIQTNIALLQQSDEFTYHATFTSIDIGELKHIRIRYLLPNTGGGNGTYSIPILFHSPYGGTPDFVTVSLRGEGDSHAYEIRTPSGLFELSDTVTSRIEYQSQYEMFSSRTTPSTIHTSSFAAGDWSGTYLLLNTEIPDSIVEMLSKRIETVFLWRWNEPFDFITTNNGIKELSVYAQKVIAQAQSLRKLIQELIQRGHAVGLIHSLERRGTTSFPLSAGDDSSVQNIVDYLNGFNEHSLYEEYFNEDASSPDWEVRESPEETVVAETQREFLQTLSDARNMFTDTGNVFHHIILQSAGDAPVLSNAVTRETVDSILDSATMYSGGTTWRGVSISGVVPSPNEQLLVPWLGYYFPPFQPSTIKVGIDSRAQSYAFPVAVDKVKNFSVTIKGIAPWDTTLSWVGYDPQGKITADFTTLPFRFDNEEDSGLVKIWARDDDQVFDRKETMLGFRYGIVTKASYLQAGLFNTTEELSSSIPFLTDDEIHFPIPVKQKAVDKKDVRFNWAFKAGTLTLTLPVRGGGMLYLYDMNGKLVCLLNLDTFKQGDNTYVIPLSRELNRYGLTTYLVRIKGNKLNRSFRITIGG